MDTETAAIAQRLNAARRAKGVAISPLSLSTGTPYTNLQQFFAGKRDLPIGKVAQVARELNLKPSEYMPDFSVTTPEATVAA